MTKKIIRDAYGSVRLSDEAKRRILETADIERAHKASVKSGIRPVRLLLAVVLTLCLLAGAALAVSPELRERLWGNFEERARDYNETEVGWVAYGGVEARMSSVISDGFVTRVHIQLRAPGDDRMREYWERFQAGEKLGLECHADVRIFDGDSSMGLLEGDLNVLHEGVGGVAFLDYDGQTGVLTAEYISVSTESRQGSGEIVFSMPTGNFGTERNIEGDGYISAWDMTVPIDFLPLRRASVGTLEIRVSDISLAVWGVAGDEDTVRSDDVGLLLADGTDIAAAPGAFRDVRDYALDRHLGYDEQSYSDPDLIFDLGTEEGAYKVRIYEFAAPIDSRGILSVMIGGVEIPLD